MCRARSFEKYSKEQGTQALPLKDTHGIWERARQCTASGPILQRDTFCVSLKIGGEPGPNLTKVGTSPLLEWGRPTSPLQWTNGDGSRWRLSAGGVTCRRTAAAPAGMGQGSYEGAVAMRPLSFKSRTQQMRSYAKCIVCIITAPLFGPGCCCCSTRSVQLQWRHLAPLGMRHL